MYNAHARWILTALALLVFGLVWSSQHLSPANSGEHPRIELMPGQEGTLEPALGRGVALPGGCAYAGAEIEPVHITAHYACPGRAAPAVLELYAGLTALPTNGNTVRFSVATAADFPPALRAAVLARLTQREQFFGWRASGARSSTQRVPPGVALPPYEVVVHDPALPLLGALILLLAFTVRLLRREPAYVSWALAALVLAGAALRLVLSVNAPMNAHSFSRVVPLAMDLYRGPLLGWLSSRGADIAFTEVQSWSNYALAVAMPVAFFAHARLLLGDARVALVAAAMMAFLPMHIRFALSDVTFIASLLASSSTFVALYGSLTDPSRAWRLGCAAMLPALSLATYSARPENIIFVALDLGALGLYLRADIPRRRIALAAALIASAAAYSAVTDLMVRYQRNVGEGLSLETLRHAVGILFDRRYNTLVNPWMTPPALPVLAVVGAVTLWRGAQRRRAVFLIAWLAAFFVVHSYVRPSTVAMQARYHLHLMSPFLLLAAAATPRVAALPRPAVAALLAWLALAPLLHAGFIRDTDYTEMHEYAFLRRLRGRLEPSCTVLEFGPAVEVPRPQSYLALRSERMSMALRGGFATSAQVRQLGMIPPGAGADAREVFALPDEFVAHPPACLYYYESAACTTHRPVPGRLAAPCEEVHRRFSLVPVAEERHPLRSYDNTIERRVITGDDGRVTVRSSVRGAPTVHLGLYRVLPSH